MWGANIEPFYLWAMRVETGWGKSTILPDLPLMSSLDRGPMGKKLYLGRRNMRRLTGALRYMGTGARQSAQAFRNINLSVDEIARLPDVKITIP